MAAIIFRYPEMESAAAQINNIAEQYRAAANALMQQVETAIQPWEGESKNKFQQFVQGPVNEYMGKTVPQIVEALAHMLSTNAKHMQEADAQVASSLPTTL
jgi:WXG100 family type VII secretion target